LANKKIIKEWFTLAIRDLKSAKALIQLRANHKVAAAFLAQQCVEKSIKGYLVTQDIRAPKTHDIESLAKLVAPVDQELSKRLLKAKKLTDYAVALRYPDAQKKPLTKVKAVAAVKLAHQVYDELLGLSKQVW